MGNIPSSPVLLSNGVWMSNQFKPPDSESLSYYFSLPHARLLVQTAIVLILVVPTTAFAISSLKVSSPCQLLSPWPLLRYLGRTFMIGSSRNKPGRAYVSVLCCWFKTLRAGEGCMEERPGRVVALHCLLCLYPGLRHLSLCKRRRLEPVAEVWNSNDGCCWSAVCYQVFETEETFIEKT